MTRPILTPGRHHPITVSPAPGPVRAVFRGKVIAESEHALLMREASYPPVHYLAVEDVDATVLVDSDTHTYCPYKGEASYYSLRDGDALVPDAVWFYPAPHEAVTSIAGHVAFYPGHVTIEE